jgi:hypothetical protein
MAQINELDLNTRVVRETDHAGEQTGTVVFLTRGSKVWVRWDGDKDPMLVEASSLAVIL